MKSRYFRRQWRGRKGETDMADYVSLTAQRELNVLLPGIDTQRAIARILGALDDKIERNREMNRTLEATAQALFRSWFVDFDPVVAKADGRRPFGMSEDLAALFPDRFVESELGPIPEGWEVTAVSQLLTVERQTVKPQEAPEEEFEHFSIPAFDAGRMPVRELGVGIKSNKYDVVEGAVLLSKLNPDIRRVWLPGRSDRGLRRICSTEFLVCVPRLPFTRCYLFTLFVEPDFRSCLSGLVTGTSNSHQRVKPKDFLRLSIPKPDDGLLDAFDGVAAPLLSRVLHNRLEAQNLADLRDLLLPKLLSGEIRVGEAESLAEATGS